jgi:hypothetical protein
MPDEIKITIVETARGPAGVGVPEGGTTGQVLAKVSATDYDTDWVSPGAASEITGLIEAGTNVTLSGAGTSASPYVINSSGGGGSGTVTSVSVITANGVSGSVATADTTPAITITLGAITPTSVNGVVLSGSSTPTLAVTGTSSITGVNTGNQTITLTGDVTGTGTGTFEATIANEAVTFAKMANVSPQILIGRHASGSDGAPQEVSVGNGVEFSGSGIQRSAFTGGDVTAAAGSASLTIADNAVTNAKAADMANGTVKARTTAETGDPEDVTFAALNAATFIAPIEKDASFTISEAENGVPILLTNTATTTEIELPFDGITPGWSQTFCLVAANPVAIIGPGSITGSTVGSLTQNQWFGIICTGSGTYRFI